MIKLPELPYSLDALEPHISKKTLAFHYEKHHAGYVAKLNDLIKDTHLQRSSLEEIIGSSTNQDDKVAIFNNAAQVWNHTFYWHSMSDKKTKISSDLEAKIIEDFGDIKQLKNELNTAAMGQFGSGWAWLVLNIDLQKLEIVKTGNAHTPLTTKGIVPLIAIDVWEHAYYLDYQNRRADYISVVLGELLNWEFASLNYQSAKSSILL